MEEAEFGYVTKEDLAVFTDLYELTMLQGYHGEGHNPRAVFDLFFRSLPENRGYLIAAGLEQAVHYLENLEFSPEALGYLGEQGFDDDFLEYLSGFQFTGDVRAVPEGTPVFPDEPVMEVEAPIMQAQLFETLLINQVTFQTMIATKAARMREVVERRGDGQSLVDFGSRRAHGTDAGVKAARASYIGGFSGTSNVAAGETFGIPVYGTMAHSWIESFETEREAFEAYVDAYGDESILLVDTYDTLKGAEKAREIVEERGVDIRGVRIDSGDLPALSRKVQENTGLDVFVSSGLDEYRIREFFREGGVATGFGVGTNLVTSADAPKLEGVYKLVASEEDGSMEPQMKLSKGKTTWPGRKSVHRAGEAGEYRGDTLAGRGEKGEGEDVLVKVFEDGERVYGLPTLEEIRERAEREREKLPEEVRRIEEPGKYPVKVGEELRETGKSLEQELS
ncbi:MAG: nicotinate phosphoribosyltransferase [Candidatus Nanohaloarchaea archaeon]|nr:nicotinate phosphoribosyltransferase [Candidatus Nanohaloarchaea archaeon]